MKCYTAVQICQSCYQCLSGRDVFPSPPFRTVALLDSSRRTGPGRLLCRKFCDNCCFWNEIWNLHCKLSLQHCGHLGLLNSLKVSSLRCCVSLLLLSSIYKSKTKYPIYSSRSGLESVFALNVRGRIKFVFHFTDWFSVSPSLHRTSSPTLTHMMTRTSNCVASCLYDNFTELNCSVIWRTAGKASNN